jgi:hypothetical protein
MKQEPANPSPLKPVIGLENGKPTVYVCAFPLSPISQMHWRETEPPKLDPDDPFETLKQLEKYFK